MLRTIQKIFDQSFSLGDTFIVGVSGGVDSMTLMYCLSKLKAYHFIIVTIDHSIRENSHDDTTFVKHEAEKLGLECYIKKAKIPSLAKQQKKGTEETARDVRYEIFKQFQKKYRAKAIITAHHQDDQIETILLHLLRGSDLHGLVGMKVINEHAIFRPLLSLSKNSITAFAQKKSILWREDETNKDIDFTRNLMRHHIVAEFPHGLFFKISMQAQKTIDILDEWVAQWINANCTISKKNITFNKKIFQNLPLYLQFYLLNHLTKHYLYVQNVSFSWLSSIYQWIMNTKGISNYTYQHTVIYTYNKSIITLLRKK